MITQRTVYLWVTVRVFLLLYHTCAVTAGSDSTQFYRESSRAMTLKKSSFQFSNRVTLELNWSDQTCAFWSFYVVFTREWDERSEKWKKNFAFDNLNRLYKKFTKIIPTRLSTCGNFLANRNIVEKHGQVHELFMS